MGEAPAFEVVLLGGLGTLLIFVEGVVVLAAVATVSAPAQITAAVDTLAVIMIVLSILLTGFLLAYWFSADQWAQSVWGVLIALLGAFSLWVGGGFLVGFVLTFTAGILAVILARMPAPPSPWTYTPSGPSTSGRTTQAPRAWAPTETGVFSEGGIVWYCMKCDEKNPIAMRVCSKCGTSRTILS